MTPRCPESLPDAPLVRWTLAEGRGDAILLLPADAIPASIPSGGQACVNLDFGSFWLTIDGCMVHLQPASAAVMGRLLQRDGFLVADDASAVHTRTGGRVWTAKVGHDHDG